MIIGWPVTMVYICFYSNTFARKLSGGKNKQWLMESIIGISKFKW